jgi:predicted TIM-barrel fold metal-dependent hydrolase
MLTIDADAHVIETERTWDYMDEADLQFRPVRLTQAASPGEGQEYWLIDGKIFPIDKVPTLPSGSCEMLDIEARLRLMDELRIDVQVLYPTLFIAPVTQRPELERALRTSYNRWMADIWRKGKGRFRWAALLPLLRMDWAVEELNMAKQNGACAVFMRGVECGNKLLKDSYFFPLYEEASRLDIPICVHTGNSNPDMIALFAGEPGFSQFKLAGFSAFHSLVFHGIPDLFPKLRFGFIELSSQWLPHVIHDLARRFERRGRALKQNILRDNRIYVACQTNDDLPYIIKYVGEDNLVMGTDYSHTDSSAELQALAKLKQDDRLSPEVRRKIHDDNARALYGL